MGAADALSGVTNDMGALMVSARRLVEHHETNAQLWSTCAHAVTSFDARHELRERSRALSSDPTATFLADAIPDDASVCTIGWSGHVGEIRLLVASDRRGAGLGGALVRSVMDEAAASGRRVSLHVDAGNPARVSRCNGSTSHQIELNHPAIQLLVKDFRRPARVSGNSCVPIACLHTYMPLSYPCGTGIAANATLGQCARTNGN